MRHIVFGAENVISALRRFGVDAKEMIKDETEAAGREIELMSKQNAASIPDAPQELKQKISHQVVDNGYGVEITTNFGPLAAYMEFGTGTHVKVAEEWKALAWKFYVNGRGTLPPTPYLYPAFNKGREEYLKTLQAGLAELTNKFNNGQ